MAYVTGVATSATDLKTAIINAATANGWTEVATDILNNGVSFVKLAIDTGLTIQGGTGVSGGSLIGVPFTGRFYESPVSTFSGNPPLLSYPLTFHIHVNASPSDIMVFVNYQTVYWQWLCFGEVRSLTGNPNGAYFASVARGLGATENRNSTGVILTAGTANTSRSSAPFWLGGYYGNASTEMSSAVDIGAGLQSAINGRPRTTGHGDLLTSYIPLYNLSLTPNSWNGEIILSRMIITKVREADFLSFVAELPHIRICRNDNYSDGDELVIGPDTWKIYPLVRKNVSVRDGATSGYQVINHSGTLALAVRKVT